MKNLKLSLATLSVVAIAFTSCRKDEKEMLADTTTNQESEQSELIQNDADNIADAAMKNDVTNYKMSSGASSSSNSRLSETMDALGGCAILTRTEMDSLNADTLLVDFGTGCTGHDGRVRKGKIQIIYTGKYWVSGSVRTQTFDGYSVNDNLVEGTRTITNNGKNASNQTNWTINAQNMKVTKSDGKTHSWNSVRTRTITTGEGTNTIWDDVYEITGTVDGVNAKGVSFSAEITSPLVKEMGCKWLKQGVVVIKVNDKPDRTLDYGNGTCDDQATVTVGNKTKTITLK